MRSWKTLCLLPTAFCLLMFCLLTFCPLVFCASPPSDPHLTEAARRLGDDDYRKREEATNLLWRAGAAAEGALREAARSGDPETASRAMAILRDIELGITPDTPPQVRDLLARYSNAEPDERQRIVDQLVALGPRSWLIPLKLAEGDTEAMRLYIMHAVSQQAPGAIPMLLAAGDRAAAEVLMQAGAAEPAAWRQQRDYAAYLLLTDQLNAKITAVTTALTAEDAQHALADTHLLAFLYRARGDEDPARRYAAEAQDEKLLMQLCEEQGKWEQAAQIAEARATQEPIVDVFAYAALYHAWAGQQNEAKAALDRLRLPHGQVSSSDLALAKILLLLDAPADALEMLANHRSLPAEFELLMAMDRTPEAIKLVEQDQPLTDTGLWLPVARAYLRVGRRDEAMALVDDARRHGVFTPSVLRPLFLQRRGAAAGRLRMVRQAAVTNPNDPARWIALELRAGRAEQAAEDARTLLGADPLEQSPQDGVLRAEILDQFFPGRGSEADAWYCHFIASKHATPEAGWALMRSVMEGTQTAAQWDDLARDAAKFPESASNKDQAARFAVAIAQTLIANARETAAADYLEKAAAALDLPDPLICLGDMRLAKADWPRAAAAYQSALAKENWRPLPLYLRGYALTKMGQQQAGAAAMELAHLLPLADDVARLELADELRKRGLKEAADREEAAIPSVAELHSLAAAALFRRRAESAAARGDFTSAAAEWDRALLPYFRSANTLGGVADYLAASVRGHALHARALLHANDAAGAMKQIAAAQAACPGDVRLAAELVPDLASHGMRKEADDLYAAAAAVHQKLATDYPGDATPRVALAILGARCGRDAGEALTLARKAAELDPRDAEAWSVVAEIELMRGDKPAAAAASAKAAALNGMRLRP